MELIIGILVILAALAIVIFLAKTWYNNRITGTLVIIAILLVIIIFKLD